jgi:hypothetical protein
MDARISDVVVTLDKRWEDKLDEAVDMLKKVGMEVSCVDAVDYVRTVFTYDAEYPPGDPRDTNGI